MNRVRDILNKKGPEVASVPEDSTVREAAEEMNERRIGAVVVTHLHQVIGIFTERDILSRVVAAGLDPAAVKVSEVLTSPVAICHSDADLEGCKAVMTEKRIRHLPVVDEGSLKGIITSGDIMAFEAGEKQATIEYLYEYLYGTQP